MKKKHRILAINPGSTSTKIAIFLNDTEVFRKTVEHSPEELKPYPDIPSQQPLREKVIVSTLEQAGEELASLSAVVGRGGLLRPMAGGTYAISPVMLKELRAKTSGEHASNLGGILAESIASSLGIPSFIVDPIVVDELEDVARISGSPLIERISIFHALNQKAVARRHARKVGRKYEEMNLIVAHLGGGVTVGAHRKGRVIDVTNALNGEGPLTPERSGGLPALNVVELCFRPGADKQEIIRSIKGSGGMTAYLGTNDGKEVQRRVLQGDTRAELIHKAMVYQTAKEIGGMAAVLKGKVEAILVTGGMAYDTIFVEMLRQAVSFIAPVHVYPGEEEMKAMTEGALRVLNGTEKVKTYPPEIHEKFGADSTKNDLDVK